MSNTTTAENPQFTLSDFKVGDHLLMTSRSKQGEEVRAAIVTAISYNGNGLVTYGGRDEKGMLPTGQGAFAPPDVGVKEFGFCVRVVKTGVYSAPWKPWSPQPGDRGYDLMH